MKKFACLLLSLIISVGLFCACSPTYDGTFIKHDYERDCSQVIVKIDPITQSGDGWEYTSEPIEIYKSQLVSYFNTYGPTYIQSMGWTYERTLETLLEQIITQELVVLESDVRFEAKDIYWTKDDIETVQKGVYKSIDSSILSLCNEILEAAGKDKLELTAESTDSDTETTYPVRDEKNEADDERVFYTYGEGNKHDGWYLSEPWYNEGKEFYFSYNGNYGDEETKSLFREAVKRYISSMAEASASLIGVTDEEKKTIENEVDILRRLAKVTGAGEAYRAIGKTLLCKKLVGDSLIDSQKMAILQDYIESSVTVTEQDILAKYNSIVETQMTKYKDSSAYDTAISGTDTILYRPNTDYVNVKHILLPFSEEQKQDLTRQKALLTTKEYEAKRAQKVNEIVVYRHKDGEDDKTKTYTVAQVFAEIKAAMSRVRSSAYESERLFDDFIYLYNTDPGIFDKENGYAVKYKLGDGESETYMVEFANAAREFRDKGYKVGEMLDHYIVTDYGVHIMYYVADYEANALGLNDYFTAGRYTTVRSYIENLVKEKAVEDAYTEWRDQKIYYYRNVYGSSKENDTQGVVTVYKDRYADLIQD